jgi:quercetin dioxygenase-like cupin family protein
VVSTDVIAAAEPIVRVNPYHDYQRGEGVPVVRGFHIADLNALELAPWARKGGRGCFVNLDGTGGTNDAYVCEIAPGTALNPQRQLFEEMVYVLEGSGSSQVWYDENQKVSFEWRAGSVFAVPLNAWHRHYNGRGDRPARYLAVTSAPLIINVFHNLDFVFGTPFAFDDRFAGQDDFFAGEGRRLRARRNLVLETNFVPDVRALELIGGGERGAGGRLMLLELANNTMAAHVSEFPVGTYKKAHRHGPGAHVIVLDGSGYSLLWPEGEEPRRVDWSAGSVVVPPESWFHQHFNSGARPARYLALRWGSQRYDLGGAIQAGEETYDVSVKDGGAQIEYADEDPAIHRQFEDSLARAGAACRMKALVSWCTAD